MSNHFDAAIIGTGQAGPALANRLTGAGVKVAVIERGRFGGTCVNTGCMPTKTMVASAYAAYLAARAADYGVTIEGRVSVNMKKVVARKNLVSDTAEKNTESWLLSMKGCTVIRGHARFFSSHEIEVGTQRLTADKVFVNVGARAVVPAIAGIDQVPVYTNETIMNVDVVPPRLLVLGGSYIGLEFAQAYRRFGSEVTVVEAAARLEPREDDDVSDAIRDILEREGINIHLATTCTGLAKRGTSIQRIWAEAGLKPHLARPFKLSNDPNFAAKVADIIGLYLDPPDKALVLCVDEKSQIQALDRTQPGLPMKKGRAATMTHDYKRNGTTTLFAALNVKTGEVIGACLPRHRAKEFIGFLKKIDRAVAKHLDLHLICDNYGTHKTAEVQAWLAKHPRFKLHFTPTSASWINLVERLFAEITRQRIRRGVFRSVKELEAAIEEWIACRNARPKPFVWTKTADTIIAKNRRARAVLEAAKTGNQALESEH